MYKWSEQVFEILIGNLQLRDVVHNPWPIFQGIFQGKWALDAAIGRGVGLRIPSQGRECYAEELVLPVRAILDSFNSMEQHRWEITPDEIFPLCDVIDRSQPYCRISHATCHLALALAYILPQQIDSYISGHFHLHLDLADGLIRESLHEDVSWLDVFMSPDQWPIYYFMKEIQHSPVEMINIQNPLYSFGLEPRAPFLGR